LEWPGSSINALIGHVQTETNRVVPAFVWGKLIDSFYSLWPDALYLSSLLGFVSIPVLRDRKLYTTGRRFAAPNNRQLICQVIESTPETVNYIPSERENLKGINGQSLHVSAEFSCLRVLIGQTNVKIFVPTKRELQLRGHGSFAWPVRFLCEAG
jgi:hypothetical protein